MLKAVRVLRAQGILKPVIGQGTTVVRGEGPAPSPPRTAAPARMPKWRGLVREIHRDVVRGVFPSGRALPPLKELRQRYGVSYPTLKRSLTALVAEGVLSSYGGTLRVPHLTTARQKLGTSGREGKDTGSRASVVLVSRPDMVPQTHVEDPRFSDFLRSLERESFLSDFRLELVSRDSVEQWGRLHGSWVLGYLIFRPLATDTPDLMGYLFAQGKPIALGSTGGPLPDMQRGGRSRLRIFYTAYTETPGRDVGEYLLRLGHRRVAYISPYHRSEWSHTRLRGLRQVFDTAGLPDAVVAYTREEYRSNDDYLRAAEARHGQQQEVPFPDVEPVMPSLLEPHVGDVRRRYRELFRDREILSYCVPIFESALADRSVTAWVCSIDYIALFALDYLSSRRVRVPGDISVVGFDDLEGARERMLSTYRFDMPTLAHNMVAHVLNPSYGPLRSSPDCLEIGGMVIERATSGPARVIR